MKKRYTSYDQVDRDLKILKLQTDIDKEEVKLSVDQVKSNISPKVIGSDLFGSVVQKALILKAISKIMGIKKMVASSKK
ncbi:DUF6327 family protein [Salegentibacter sp. F188]|uniref:DUF6327 family protein n=1 Tax=Autumnicola patrickiae TaxID=3075591 RepID=A0ABU3E3J4_9FLAO|nr:DUF6327 family protein [Salegentibacter sp. F188]MDT0690463.1 DUF6327 family protein [Salegentibacter sp. F188]